VVFRLRSSPIRFGEVRGERVGAGREVCSEQTAEPAEANGHRHSRLG